MVEHKHAHSVEKDDKVLESELFAAVGRLGHYDTRLLWVVSQKLDAVWAANRVLYVVPDGEARLPMQH